MAKWRRAFNYRPSHGEAKWRQRVDSRVSRCRLATPQLGGQAERGTSRCLVDENREQAESAGWARIIALLKSSMPIRPQYKWFYPIDWPLLSAMIRFERAKGRCQRCGRPHGREIRHLGDGRWWDEDERTWRNGRGRRLARRVGDDIAIRSTRIVLAAAHLDHDPTNNRLRNLKALCQRCHMLTTVKSTGGGACSRCECARRP